MNKLKARITETALEVPGKLGKNYLKKHILYYWEDDRVLTRSVAALSEIEAKTALCQCIDYAQKVRICAEKQLAGSEAFFRTTSR